jgi:hypothetical protein
LAIVEQLLAARLLKKATAKRIDYLVWMLTACLQMAAFTMVQQVN